MREPLLTYIIRSSDDSDLFPDELKEPLSHADDLLDNGVTIAAIDINEDPEVPEESRPKAEVIENGPLLVSLLLSMCWLP